METGFLVRFLVRLIINTGAFYAGTLAITDLESEGWEITLFFGGLYGLAMIALHPLIALIARFTSEVVLMPFMIGFNLLMLYAAEAVAEQLEFTFTLGEAYWAALGAFVITVIVLLGTSIFRNIIRGL